MRLTLFLYSLPVQPSSRSAQALRSPTSPAAHCQIHNFCAFASGLHSPLGRSVCSPDPIVKAPLKDFHRLPWPTAPRKTRCPTQSQQIGLGIVCNTGISTTPICYMSKLWTCSSPSVNCPAHHSADPGQALRKLTKCRKFRHLAPSRCKCGIFPHLHQPRLHTTQRTLTTHVRTQCFKGVTHVNLPRCEANSPLFKGVRHSTHFHASFTARGLTGSDLIPLLFL